MDIFFDIERDGKDIELEVTARYTAATPDVYYLSNGDPGYPGDPEEIELLSATDLATKKEFPVAELTSAELAQIEDKIREKAQDDCFDAPEPPEYLFD